MVNRINDSQFKMILKSLIIMLMFIQIYCNSQCGMPGYSKKTKFKNIINEYKLFEQNSVINYYCDYNDAPFLIGYPNRRCENGRWTNSIPKCGKFKMFIIHLPF